MAMATDPIESMQPYMPVARCCGICCSRQMKAQGVAPISARSSAILSHDLCSHPRRQSSITHRLLRPSRCSTTCATAPDLSCSHRQSGVDFSLTYSLGSSSCRAPCRGTKVACAALTPADLTGRRRLRRSRNTTTTRAAAHTLTRGRPMMGAAAGNHESAEHQPPIEELAQDAVVWATQHGLVRRSSRCQPDAISSVSICTFTKGGNDGPSIAPSCS
jgi:hypothetical protein